jgi:hypothetical protein
MVFLINHLILITLLPGIAACGVKTDTGRNGDPNAWPESDNLPVSDSGSPSNTGETDSCFSKPDAAIPTVVDTFCSAHLKTNPSFRGLHKILCEEKKLWRAMESKTCGWTGQLGNIKKHMHFYAMEQDQSKDYADIHASIIRTPVSLERLMTPVRLAFENYPEFKRLGYRWLDGTREHVNLSNTTWEQGVQYRFRATKESYELGYQGHNTLYKLDEQTFVHLNYATGDYERILEFAQVVVYRRVSEGSSLVIKLEQRKVQSSGLYAFAKKTGYSLTRELMEKVYSNATKP